MLATPPQNWLLSKRADLGLFGGSFLLSLALLGAGWWTGDIRGDAPLWIWLATVAGVDVSHVWATAYRTYLDRDEFGRRTLLYSAIPVSCYAIGVVAYSVSPLAFWRLLAYVAVFHFVRQQYGWVALYRRKNGENEESQGPVFRWIDSLTIYAVTVAPLIFWHTHLPRRFHWFLAGDFASGLPSWPGPAALTASALILLIYTAKEIVRHSLGSPISWGKNLVVLSTAVTWFLGIVVFNSDYAFTVTNVLIHGIPYFGIVLATSRQRAVARAANGRPLTLADLLSRSALVFMLPLVLVALLEEWGWDRLVWHENGAIFPGPEISPGPLLLAFVVPLLALPQATHYALDAWIWKVRDENREAAAAMGLKAGN